MTCLALCTTKRAMDCNSITHSPNQFSALPHSDTSVLPFLSSPFTRHRATHIPLPPFQPESQLHFPTSPLTAVFLHSSSCLSQRPSCILILPPLLPSSSWQASSCTHTLQRSTHLSYILLIKAKPKNNGMQCWYDIFAGLAALWHLVCPLSSSFPSAWRHSRQSAPVTSSLHLLSAPSIQLYCTSSL